MRITLVIGNLGGGGAERVCVNLANAWVERGWHVTVVTRSQGTRPPAYFLDSRVKRRDLNRPRIPHARELNHDSIAPVIHGLREDGCLPLISQIGIIAMLRYAILASAPDVVIPLIDRTNVTVLAAMYGTEVPVIACEVTDCTRISAGDWQSMRKTLYRRRARAVVAPHPKITEWLARQGAPACTIPNPLQAPPPMRIQQNGKRRRIVMLSRLSAEKRPMMLLHAFTKVAAEFPDWDLEIHGDGPLWWFVERRITEMAPGRIHLHAFDNAAYRILEGADLSVSTSWVEGFGNSIWEALACGVPVVAMDAGAPIRSLVRDGIDGLIVREDSIPALASALARLMRDDALRQAFAERAPDVLKRFSIESALEKWDELLASVCQ